MTTPVPALSLVIPVFDEADRIAATLRHVTAFLETAFDDWELLVVLDGGPAGIEQIVRRTAADDRRIRILPGAVNRGKGHAVRIGVLASTGRRVGFLDADLAQPIEAVPRFLEALAAGADLAVGRRVGRSQPAPLRRAASALFGRLARLVLGVPVRDSQCGMKVGEGRATRDLCRVQSVDRFAFDAEWLVIARSWGLRIAEVPIEVTPPGSSAVRLMRDGTRMLVDLLRIRRRLRRGAYARPSPPAGT